MSAAAPWSVKGIDPKALLGKSATVVVETDGGGKRYIDGLVSRRARRITPQMRLDVRRAPALIGLARRGQRRIRPGHHDRDPLRA